MDSTSGTPSGPTPGKLASGASVVASATLASRILGLVREQVFAALLGASGGIFADAFVVAFRIPNLLRDLFAEGVFSSAFVPTFTEHVANRPREEAWRLASLVFTTLAIVLAAISLVGILGAHWVVVALAPGFRSVADKTALTTQLARIMFPFLPMVALAAAAMGILNSFGRFFVPAIAPAVFNVVTIAVGLALWALGLPPAQVVAGWSIGVLLGGTAQFLVQTPSLGKIGYRYRPALDLRFRDPGLRRILVLMGPAAIGLAATQLNQALNTVIASLCEQGSQAWLNCAFRLVHLPIGLFGVAIATVSTAGVAHRVARGDVEGMRETLASSLKLLSFLCIPSTVGLWVLSEPIIRLVYEHGRFVRYDTIQTASALSYFAVGLYAYSTVKVLGPAFYALGHPRIPVRASFVAVAVNLAISFSTFRWLGHVGLALGTSVAALVNFAHLFLALERVDGSLRGRGLAAQAVRVSAASVGMGFVAWGAWRAGERWIGAAGVGPTLVTTFGAIGAGCVAYALLCRLLGVPEMEVFARGILRRLGARP